MKRKALLCALLMVVAVGWSAQPASAATYNSSYSELSLPAKANLNTQVTLSGRITPVTPGRAVSLYRGLNWDGSGGTWIAGATTDANGRFSFTTTVTSVSSFKFFSAKHTVGSNVYQNVSTGVFYVSPPDPVTYPSSYSELSIPGQTNTTGQVVLSGRIQPALQGRPVSLYETNADGSGEGWKAGTATDANGYFSFVTQVTGTKRYKFFSQSQPNGSYITYANAATGYYPVTSDFTSAFSEVEELTNVAYTGSGNQQFQITGRLWPVGPQGRAVSIYRDQDHDPDTDNSVYAGGVTTGADGRFTIILPVSSVTTFNLYAGPQSVGTARYDFARSARFTVRSLRVWDEFNYGTVDEFLGNTASDGKPWTVRQPDYQVDDPNIPEDDDARTKSKGSRSAVGLVADPADRKDKVLRLSVKWDTDPAHPGKFLTGHISRPLDFVYGHFEASVKVGRPQGAVAGYWHQTRPGNADYHEFDVIESWGKGGPAWDPQDPEPWLGNPRVQHTVHRHLPKKQWRELTYVNDSWFDLYHTVYGEWAAGAYRYKIDNGEWQKLETEDWIGTKGDQGQLILSLLVDDEHADFLGKKFTQGAALPLQFDVDWVRVWR